MNPYHRAVRAALVGMERERAVRWLAAHPLDQEERDCIAEIEVRHRHAGGIRGLRLRLLAP